MISIIIADDHTIVREGLRTILESHPDFEVTGEAANGVEAIALVTELSPDIVVLDIEMPEMNGIVAASEIYASSQKTKILALSRHNEKQYIAEMFAAGASGYILKDSAVEELIKAISTVVSGQLYCSPSLMDVVINDYTDRLTHSGTPELSKLTPREIEVLKLIAEGKTLKEVASDLYISYPTAATHRSQIMKKLDIHTDVELAKFAIREGLISL